MPMFRRAGRPGLIATAARTAVIAGTAQATAGAVASRQHRRAEERQMSQMAAMPAPPPAPAPPPPAPAPPAPAPAPGPGGDLLAQLEQLGKLHAAGVLTADEFTAAKARLLS